MSAVTSAIAERYMAIRQYLRSREARSKLWIVGQKRGASWDFQGVFDDERKAIEACRSWNYFIAPATLNDHVPDGVVEWPGLRWPLAESESAP
jgi:hypothetical protein